MGKTDHLIKKQLKDILDNKIISSRNMQRLYHFEKKLIDYFNWILEFEKKILKRKRPNRDYMREFDKQQEMMVRVLFSLENNISSSLIMRELRGFFRTKLKKYIFQSKILKHAYDKPRGYPGDYFLFETAYNDKPLSKSLGYYFDMWMLRHPLTDGIRYRKDRMKVFLKNLVQKDNEEFSVANMGCGSGRELREFLFEEKNAKINCLFYCYDQDNVPLKFCNNSLSKMKKTKNILFYKTDVFKIIGLRNSDTTKSSFDLIYSMGIVDYFLMTTLEYFIKSCFNLLKKNGRLIIPFCCSYNPLLYVHLRWFAEWNFYIHYPNFILNFVKKKLLIKKASIIWEDKQPIFFLIISK